MKFILIFFLIFPFYLKGEDFIFEDFLSNTNKDWEFISDNVMGGISFGKLKFISEEGYTFARLTGKVSLENNGGFIQFRRTINNLVRSDRKGIKIYIRGNNQKYFVHIRTKNMILPWQYYQASFFANKNWGYVELPFETFERSGFILSKKINPKDIISLAIVAFGYVQKVRVDVRSIIFY